MKMASVEYVFKYCDIPSNITILRILATEERKWQEGEGMKRRDMKDKRGKRVHMRACTFCDRGLRGHRVIFLAPSGVRQTPDRLLYSRRRSKL